MGTQVRSRRAPTIDYRTYLEGKLGQAKKRIKGSDAATGIAIVAVAWISYVLLLVMLDHLVELPAWIRTILLVAMVIVTCVILFVRVAYPMFCRVNALFAARTVEAADPKMKNSVLNWVELSQKADQLPEPVLKSIENRAAVDLARVRIEDAIQPRYVLASMYVLAGVVITFCLFSFLTTKSFGPSVQRVLFPFAGVAPPTATHLRIHFDPSATELTEPGSIPVGGSMVFRAYVERGNPDSVIAYVRPEGEEYEAPHDLTPTQAGSREFVLTLHQRQRTFDIRFVAGDFSSPSYRIRVTAAPAVVDWTVHYEPPAYTGLAPFSSPTPEIDGLEGTSIRVEATTNLPVLPGENRLELRMNNVESTAPMLLVDGSSNRLAGDFTLTGDGFYSLSFRDSEGRAPDFRPNYSIRMRKDLPPSIQFEEPAAKEIELPTNGILIVRARAADDFGLQKVQLKVRHDEGGEVLFSRDYPELGGSLGTSLEFDNEINLAEHDLKAGQVLEYWIDAEDNKRPVSNSVSTQRDRRIVKLVEPPPQEEQASKPDERRKQEQNKQESSDSKPQDQAQNRQKREGQPQDGQKGAEGQQGEQKAQPSTEGEKETSDSRGAGKAEGKPAEPSNPKDAAESSSESELGDEDRDAVQKLQEYFNDKQPKGDKNESDNQPGEEKQDAQDPDARQQKESAPEDMGEPSNDQKGNTSETVPKPKRDTKEQPSDATSKQSGKGQSTEEKDSSSKEQTSPDPMRDPSKQAQQKQPEGQQTSDSGSPDESEKQSAEASQQGEPKKSADAKTAEESREKKSQGGKETSDAQGNDQPSATSDSEPKDAEESESGAGKPSEGTQQRPDAAAPGDPSQQDNGKERQSTHDDAPRPESEEKGEQKNPDGSHREGPDKSSAASAADSEGPSNQGESSAAGQSSTGSPSEEQADNSNSTGQQKGEGQSEGPGGRKAAEKTPGQDGQPQDASNKDDADGDASVPEEPGEPSEPKLPSENAAAKDGDKIQGDKQGKKESDSAEEQDGNSTDSDDPSKATKDEQNKAEGKGKDRNEGKSPSDRKEGQEKSSKPGADDSGDMDPSGKSGEQSAERTDQKSQPGEGKRNPKGGGAVDPNKVSDEEVTGDNKLLDNSGDEANAEDKKKGSELVLKRLEEELQKKKVDPELLKRMGWTEKDARDFYERLRRQGQEDKTAPIASDNRGGFGRGTDLRGRSERAAGTRSDDLQDLQTGRRTAVPPELRKRFEAYTKSLSKKGSE